MSDKISPFAVIKETLGICWARKWSFLGLFFSGFVLMAIPSFLPLLFQESAQVIVWAAYPLMMVVGIVLYTAVWHLAITQMRGAGRVFPASLARACVDVFIRGLVCMLLLLPVMAVTMGPVTALLVSVLPQDGVAPDIPLMVGISLLGIVAYAFVVWVALRLSLMPVGAAVGHRMWVKEAWRMTRGHGLRMIAAGLILFVAYAVVFVPVALGLIASQASGASAVIFLLLAIIIFLLAIATSVVAYVLPAVWYEKLRLRHEATEPAPPADETQPADEPAA